jgi:uncharacterized membrane protein YfcA
MDALLAIVIGLGAGFVAGMLGVGGGLLFVPALTLALGLSQVDAEATSLLAIIPVSALGAWRQHRYGNVHLRDGLTVGVLAAGGVVAGVALANALPEHTLKLAFAGLMLVIAARLIRKALLDGRDLRRAEGAARGGPRDV